MKDSDFVLLSTVVLLALVLACVYLQQRNFFSLAYKISVSRFKMTFQKDDFLDPLKEPKQLKRKQTLSLTTTPTRLKRGLHSIFQSFHPDQLHRILLHIPKNFRNKNDPESQQERQYLDDLIEKVPKLQVLVYDNDSGPDMKFLGCLDACADDEYIIVMDDDTFQKNTLLEDYDQVFDHAEQSNPKVIASPLSMKIYGININPGFASFGVKRGHIDKDLFLELNRLQKESSKQCQRHDDFSMGAAFQDLGFEQVRTSSGEPLQSEIGFDSDALFNESSSFIKHSECSKAIWNLRGIRNQKFQPTFVERIGLSASEFLSKLSE